MRPHLDAGYDSYVTREPLDELGFGFGFDGNIKPKGEAIRSTTPDGGS
ncbi:hypothetical protein ACQEVI_21535 [Promicromonospora sp. CA-289599]